MHSLKHFISKIIFLAGCFLTWLPLPILACTMQFGIRTAITPVTLDLIKKAITLAEKKTCASVLMEIDTPGGSLPATRLIVQEILNSPLPFLCLVSPKGAQATSAGAIILQACHVSGALRGTNLGASTPVLMGKQMDKDSDMRRKVVNDTVSFVKSLSNLRKRNEKFAEEIVTQAKSVTAEEALSLQAIDWTGDKSDDFLNFSKGRIVEMGEGKKIAVVTGSLQVFPMGFRYSILNFFADPQILYLLFLGSIMLIYFEFTHPGTMVPGVVGGIGLIISLVGLNALSVAWGAVALIFAGLILFLVEMLVPSFGILGIGGVISFVLGSVYLFDPVEMGGYQLPLFLILAVSIVVGLLMLGACYLAVKTIKMEQNTTAMGAVLNQEGEVTEILDELGKKGWIIIHGENWKFRSEKALKVGNLVTVVKHKKMELTVEKISES